MDKSILNLNNTDIIKNLTSAQRKHFDILMALESREILVYKENILAHQDTSKVNYPLLLKEFIKDVNKSSELIIKAIMSLYCDEVTKELISTDMSFLGHNIHIDIENKLISSTTAKENLLKYLDIIRINARLLYREFKNKEIKFNSKNYKKKD